MPMIYDIRSTERAQRTLSSLTGVPIPIWERYLGHEREYTYTDDLVADVIDTHGHLPDSYQNFEFIYFHVTTSANECLSIQQHGLLDLKRAYSSQDSELKIFLEERDIHIDLDEKLLIYGDQKFDITFHSGFRPRQDTTAQACWGIGRKFYYDFTSCGFLSVWERSPYGGQVHHRPEILSDIEKLLKLQLSQEWASTHEPYEIVAKVSGEKIVYNGDDGQSERDKVLTYLTKAYWTAFGEPSEEILLIRSNVQIPPEDIIEIKPLSHWK